MDKCALNLICALAISAAVGISGCASTSGQQKPGSVLSADASPSCNSRNLLLPESKADGGAVPLVAIAPNYPARPMFRHVTGVVKFGFTVDKNGKACDVALLFSSPQGVFELSALAALVRSKFKPMTVNGSPIPSYATFTYRFKLPGRGIKEPAVIDSPTTPGYPLSALVNHVEGSVTLAFTVDTSGHAQDPVVVQAEPNHVFDKPAVRALMHSRFKVKRANGQPVPYQETHTYRFAVKSFQ